MAESLSKRTGRRAIQGGLLLGLLATALPGLTENLLDPTRPPAMLERAPEGGATVSASGPVLQSVMMSPGRMIAIISGQTVKLGEKFGEAQLIKITESEVVLRSGKDLQTLKLFPGIEKRLVSSHAGERRGQ